MKRDDRLSGVHEGMLIDTDESDVGVVWVASSSTVALMAATVIAAVTGFTVAAVTAVGMVAICCAILTVAAVAHHPRFGPLPLVEDNGEGWPR